MAEALPFVLSVIAASRGAAGQANEIRQAAASVSFTGEIDWLARDLAFDIAFAEKPERTLALSRQASKDTLDINVVPAANRRKRLLIADMESTIIDCECVDELAEIAGIKPKIAEITRRTMNGEIAFEAALKERVGLLKGLKLDALERVYKDRVRLNPGARELVATMRANGTHTMLVSGGFAFFASRVAKDLGFDTEQANALLDDGVALTGKVGEPILGRHAKREALDHAVAELGLTADDVLAVGDGANDIDMVKRAGLGVAWHAKPVLVEAARVQIAHADLTALLYLQGYHESEILSA